MFLDIIRPILWYLQLNKVLRHVYMRYFFRIPLFTLLFWISAVPAFSAVQPFVKTDWGVSPVQVMNVMGVPAFNKVNFEAKQTHYLAYRQTISAYNFIFYYIFKEDKLYQVRVELKENLLPANAHDLAETINGLMESSLAVDDNDTASETTIQTSALGEPFASSVWWYTPVTFAAVMIDAGSVNNSVLFDVLLLDVANPANGPLLAQYKDITEQLKVQKAEAEQKAQQAAFNAESVERPPDKPGFKTKLAGVIKLLNDNLIYIVIVLVFVVILMVIRRIKHRQTDYVSNATVAASAGRQTFIAGKAAKAEGGRFIAGKTMGGAAQSGFTGGKSGGLRMVSASKGGSTKGTKLSFRK